MADPKNPGGGFGSVGTPDKPKPKANPNPGGGTGSVGAPVSPIGTAAKSRGNFSGFVPDRTGQPATSAPVVGATPAVPTSATPPVALTADQQSVYTQIAGVLGQAGLSSLWQQVWNKSLAGEGNDQILFELEQTPEYKQRFAGNVALQAKGDTPLKPGDYLAYETAVRNQAQLYGIDPSHVSQQAIGDLIGNNVSAAEATSRLQTYYQASQQIDPAARDYLARNYGITTGNLMDLFMNPTEHLAALQAKVNAAQVGGAATQTGWGELDANYAMRLAQAGETQGSALSAFSKLAGMHELADSVGGQSVTRQDELSAEFDKNAAAQQKIADVQAGRVAAFAGGGNLASNQSGVTALRDPNAQY